MANIQCGTYLLIVLEKFNDSRTWPRLDDRNPYVIASCWKHYVNS